MEKELTKIVKDAGKMLLENFRKSDYARILKIKNVGNYSIKMDQKVEEFILSSLSEKGIEGSVVTEEKDRTKIGKDSKYTFYIDPLDGSVNYSRGLPYYCISIGVATDGKIVLGIVYDPNHDELFTASLGNGAFLNKREISVNKNMKGVTVVANELPEETPRLFKEQIKDGYFWITNRWSTALDFCYTACGRYDAAVLPSGFWDVWDIAASAFVAEQAGAIVTNFQNKSWNVNDKTIIASSSKGLHERLLKLVK